MFVFEENSGYSWYLGKIIQFSNDKTCNSHPSHINLMIFMMFLFYVNGTSVVVTRTSSCTRRPPCTSI